MAKAIDRFNNSIAINNLKSNSLSEINKQDQRLIMGGAKAVPVLACVKGDGGKGSCIAAGTGFNPVEGDWDFPDSYPDRFVLYNDGTIKS